MSKEAYCLNFFKTDEGTIHTGRISGTFYIITLVGVCMLLDELTGFARCGLSSREAGG
jgi:hypothetical protein